jgi:hypothetical protein
MWNVEFYDHFLYFTVIWYVCSSFGMFYQEISGNPGYYVFQICSPDTINTLYPIFQQPKDLHMWLGGTDAASEDTFVWVSSGTPFSFQNWGPGEPNNSGGPEPCLTMWFEDGQWNDLRCEKLFVCGEKQ